MSITANTGGCGCGGSGCSCCGGSCAGSVCVDEAFKRPRFFAGQLLTEDDLQALTDYVVGKNRLHNRYLFGDGVVCGLSVTCHPCGGDKVTVAPGYALDCCGNDLLVPCKEELDVKSLIRDLRQRQLEGYDCGDPCEKDDGSRRTYGLYLAYDETPEGLVAPYTSGDPCGQQECQPSRICEGYKFELRCDCGIDDRADVFTRITACVGDLKSAAAALAKAQVNQVMAQELDSGVQMVRAEQPVPFTATSVDTMREAESKLAPLKEMPAEGEDAAVKMTASEHDLRLRAADYQALMGAVVRFKSQPADAREALLKENPDLKELLPRAEETLSASGPNLVELAKEGVTDRTVRERIGDNVKLADAYAIGERPDETYNSIQAQMIAYNAPISASQMSTMSTNASLLKSWLLERLDSSASQTRCDLYDRAMAVSIPGVSDNAVAEDISVVEASNRAVRELAKILLEYFVDCVCLALNPSCRECCDTSVLLACLTVEQCEVVDICNMSRRFVLSPTAMSYWLPPLGWIGKLAERLCCELDFSKLFQSAAKPVEVDSVDVPPNPAMAMMAEQPSYGRMSVASTYVPDMATLIPNDETAMVLEKVKLPATDLRVLGDFSANLAMLSTRAVAPGADLTELRTNALVDKVSTRLKSDLGKVVLDSPAIGERLTALTKEGLGTASADIATELKAEMANELKTANAAARDDIAKELKADLSKEAEAANAATREDLAKELKADLAKEAEAANTATREEITKVLKADMAKEAETANAATREDLAKELNVSVAKDVEDKLKSSLTKDLTASLKTNVADSVKEAVGKELTATKLNTAVGKLANIKSLVDENKKLKADLKALTTSVRKLEGGTG